MRVKITLACTECKQRNYATMILTELKCKSIANSVRSTLFTEKLNSNTI